MDNIAYAYVCIVDKKVFMMNSDLYFKYFVSILKYFSFKCRSQVRNTPIVTWFAVSKKAIVPARKKETQAPIRTKKAMELRYDNACIYTI